MIMRIFKWYYSMHSIIPVSLENVLSVAKTAEIWYKVIDVNKNADVFESEWLSLISNEKIKYLYIQW